MALSHCCGRCGAGCLCRRRQVLEGYGRMLVLAVGPHTQQGQLSVLVGQGRRAAPAAAGAGAAAAAGRDTLAAAGAAGGDTREGDGAVAGGSGCLDTAAVAQPAGSGKAAGMREETFLQQKLEVLAQQIGGVGVVAAGGVFAINAARLTWHQLADPHHVAAAMGPSLALWGGGLSVRLPDMEVVQVRPSLERNNDTAPQQVKASS